MHRPRSITKILRLFIAGFFISVATNTSAQQFVFNESCRQAYDAAISLQFESAQIQLKEIRKGNSGNLIPVLIEDYIDFLKLFTNDTRALYEQLKYQKDIRIEQLKAGDRRSPYYLYSQAEVILHWAVMDIRFGEYMSSILSIRKAYKLLEENNQRFPSFEANNKSLGLLYALVGSVPDKYKWGVTMLGMEGSVPLGMKMLSELANSKRSAENLFQHESATILAFLQLHIGNDAAGAWNTIQSSGFLKSESLMDFYTTVHIGVYSKRNEDVLAQFKLPLSANASKVFPYTDYIHGIALLQTGDTTALKCFRRFVTNYKGENHLKSAFQKIAWCYILKGDTAAYFDYMGKVELLGASLIDADKQAMKEAEAGKLPNVNLLRTRLLFDGGYYNKALRELDGVSDLQIKDAELQTEILYRYARIYHEQSKLDSALSFYQQSITTGKALPRYFAANAALESGRIYEERGNREKAISYYQMATLFEHHEYKNGIDQKAKAGLSRLK